jgi:hypothetical protein
MISGGLEQAPLGSGERTENWVYSIEECGMKLKVVLYSSDEGYAVSAPPVGRLL